MFENPRRGRKARNFTTNAPKNLDLKSSSEQIFSRKLPLGAPAQGSHSRVILYPATITWLSIVSDLNYVYRHLSFRLRWCFTAQHLLAVLRPQFLTSSSNHNLNTISLTKSNTVLNVFLSYFWKLFLTCFVK